MKRSTRWIALGVGTLLLTGGCTVWEGLRGGGAAAGVSGALLEMLKNDVITQGQFDALTAAISEHARKGVNAK